MNIYIALLCTLSLTLKSHFLPEMHGGPRKSRQSVHVESVAVSTATSCDASTQTPVDAETQTEKSAVSTFM